MNCSICKSDNYDIKEGFIVCLNCGTVNGNVMKETSECRQYNDDFGKVNSNTRCSFSNKPLGSEMETGNTLRGWKYNETSSTDRHLHSISEELNELSLEFFIKNKAFELYTMLYKKMVNTKNIKKCTLREGLKAACIYYTYRLENYPIEKKDITKICNTSNKIVTKGCNYFLDVMGKEYITLEQLTPLDFVTKYSNMFGIQDQIKEFIIGIIKLIMNEEEFIDTSPTSIVVVTIYYLILNYHLSINVKELIETCGVSSVVIKKNLEKINRYTTEIKQLYSNHF